MSVKWLIINLFLNGPMPALAAALGFVAARDPDDPEQVIVTLELGA